MKNVNEQEIEFNFYTVRLGPKQTAQLKYLSQILQSKSLKYTLETLIESAFINCLAYQDSLEDYQEEDEDENGEGI
jgi:hypothetical protein